MWKWFSKGEYPDFGREYITFTGCTMVKNKVNTGILTQVLNYDHSKDLSSALSTDTWWKYKDDVHPWEVEK